MFNNAGDHLEPVPTEDPSVAPHAPPSAPPTQPHTSASVLTPTTSSPDKLPTTGGDVTWLVLLAVVMGVVGVALIAVQNRWRCRRARRG